MCRCVVLFRLQNVMCDWRFLCVVLMLCRAPKVDDKELNQQIVTDATSVDIGSVKFVSIVDHFMI